MCTLFNNILQYIGVNCSAEKGTAVSEIHKIRPRNQYHYNKNIGNSLNISLVTNGIGFCTHELYIYSFGLNMNTIFHVHFYTDNSYLLALTQVVMVRLYLQSASFFCI